MNSLPYTINYLKNLISAKKIIWKEHATIRLVERGISRKDVLECIISGDIIEEYVSDKPFPSCLILGFLSNNKPIHVVCSTDNEYLYIITAYVPTLYKWNEDFKTRKEIQS